MPKLCIEYSTASAPITNGNVFLKDESSAADLEKSLSGPYIGVCVSVGLILAIIYISCKRRRAYINYSA